MRVKRAMITVAALALPASAHASRRSCWCTAAGRTPFWTSARQPIGVRSRLLQAYLDHIVPMDQARRFAARASAAGDESQWTLLEASGHFDAVSPLSPLFCHVLDELRSLFVR
jgi:pimeloyl-ACP methyl ester carboxylesterase